MTSRPRDPDCTCKWSNTLGLRIWCEHCLADGPLPGSLADPSADENEEN